MKRYEKLGMSTEDALKWAQECAKRNCLDCPAYKNAQRPETIVSNCAPSYLLSDVPEPPKVPRWQTAKTQEGFDKLFTDFKVFCKWPTGCPLCKFKDTKYSAECICAYLSELVECWEEKEND